MTNKIPITQLISHQSISKISPYIAGKSQLSNNSEKKIIKLSSNENPYGCSEVVQKAIQKSISNLHRYPTNYSDLHDAIAKFYNIKSSLNIISGAGSDEVISMICHLFGGKNREIIYSQYGFLMYRIYALSHGATPITAEEENLRTSVENILAKITNRTSLIFIANPNNPTGSYITREEILYLLQNIPNSVKLVIDCAYAEYAPAFDQDNYSNCLDLIYEYNNLIVTHTFSKIHGLGGLRVGWGAANEEIISYMNRIRSPFNISSLGVVGGIAALQDKEFITFSASENASEYKRILKNLENNENNITLYPSLGNFILMDFHSVENKISYNQKLEEQAIIVRDVTSYGLPTCLRITIGTKTNNDLLCEVLTEKNGTSNII